MEKTALTSVIGTPSESTWSQAQSFVTQSGFEVGVVICLKHTGESDVLELAPIGGAIISSLRTSLESVSAIGNLAEIVARSSAGGTDDVAISLSVCVVVQGQLLVAGSGEMASYLLRGDDLVKLGEGDSLMHGVAGKLQGGDVLLVATRATTQLLGLTQLRELLAEGEFAAESIAPLIHKQPDSSNVAMVIGSYGERMEHAEQVPALSVYFDQFKAIFKRPIRVDSPVQTPRRVNKIVALSALAFLIVMIGFGYVRRVSVIAEQAHAQVVTQVEQQLGEARSIADLNPERARMLLAQSLQIASAYSEQVTKEPYNTQAIELVEHIRQAEGEIFKVAGVALTPFIELGVLASGLSSENMYLDENEMLFFPDTTSARVVGMNIEDKSKLVIDTSAVGKLSSLAFFGTKYYGVSEQGIAEFGQKTEPKIVIEKDPLWGSINAIESYAGNLYLLDRGASEIWKYPVITDGFGARQRWLGKGIVLDLSKVSAMKVTGDIWLTTGSGKLERYLRGVPAEFSMDGFPAVSSDKRLLNPVSLFVGEEEVYVLEQGANRVVVFGVEGKYKAQYVSEEFGDAKALVVHDGKGHVLIGDVVKVFEL